MEDYNLERMKKSIFLTALFVIFISFYGCKNAKDQTKNKEQQNKEIEAISEAGKTDFINLTQKYGEMSKYEENIEILIDSVLMKAVNIEVYGLRVYLSGNYNKYNNPSFLFHLHLFPAVEEIALLPEKRVQYKYDNIQFPFKVLNDESGKPYIYKEFETSLSSIKQMELIVTNRSTKNSRIAEIHYKDIPLY